MKKLLAGVMGAAAIAASVSLAPSASADYFTSEYQYVNTLYANNIVPMPGLTTNDLVRGGYWVCATLGNHSGGYVASQVWAADHVSWYQANTIVYAAIANLCPWRWY